MELELSDGKFISDPSIQEVEDAVRKTSASSLDHCILSRGEDFIQTAGGRGGLILQYHDSQGMFESSRECSEDEVVSMFTGFFNGGNEWKGTVSFQSTGRGGDGSARTGPQVPGGGFSLKDTITSAIKQETTGNVSRMARRAVRSVFRKLF